LQPTPRHTTEPTLADELMIDPDPADEPTAPPPHALAHPIFIAIGLMAVAFNLRPALSSVAPLLPQIREDTGLTATLAGVLTTVPVLCLGLFGPLGPRMTRRYGAEMGVLVFLVVLAAGLALRGTGSLPALFAGTILSGIGIGVIGVVVPGIVKRDFPNHPGLMTGLYTMVLCFGGALGAGLTVPLQSVVGSGWAPPLMVWSLPAIAAILVWLPQVHVQRHHARAAPRGGARALWRDPLAWAVTGFMGLQSSLAYIIFGWLPVALQDRGLTARDAGFLASASVMAQAVTSLIVPSLAARRPDQRLWVAVVVGASAVGFVALMLGPLTLAWPSAIVLGFGCGGNFGLGITLIVLRSRDPHAAAQLSAMAQSVGYCLASLGPLAVGLAHDWTHGWTLPTALYTGFALAALACGLRAGRREFVLERA
jgi:CP family cyanate transporter-like MFS transporter